MKKLFYIIPLLVFTTVSCSQDIIFDENEIINHQVKKNINEYISLNINPKFDFVISIKKEIKVDTVEFIIYAHNSIETFKEDSVYFRAKYLNTIVFSNFKNQSFDDSCSLKNAAKYLNKEEYEYYLKENKIPPPFLLFNTLRLKLIFVHNKLIKREQFY